MPPNSLNGNLDYWRRLGIMDANDVVYTSNTTSKLAKELKAGDKLFTDRGWLRVKSISTSQKPHKPWWYVFFPWL